MTPQVIGKCLLETAGALVVFKSVQMGMNSSHFQPIIEPIKLSAWDAASIAHHDHEIKNIVRADGLLAASGVSLLYILSPYIRSSLTSARHNKHISGNVFLLCKNTYTFAHGFLPQNNVFRRILLVGGLVLALPTLLPPKSVPPAVVSTNSFIKSDMYEPVSQFRKNITYPLLEIFLFHKILFLRVLPIIGPTAAHALTAVAYTVASSSHQNHENSSQPVQIMAHFNESVIMQLSFYLSGGRVLYPFIFSTVQNVKDLVFQFLTSFSIFEHSHIHRAMLENAVSENLKVYGVANKGSKGLDIFIETPQNVQEVESFTALSKSLASTNKVVNLIATRALQHFASSVTSTPHLSLLDSVDFIFAFRIAVGMTRTHCDQPLIARLNVQSKQLSAGSDVQPPHKATTEGVGTPMTPPPNRESLFNNLPIHLIPVFCTDMAHVLVMKKYPHGMDLEDIQEYISEEIMMSNGTSSLTDAEMLQVEARMYELWPSPIYSEDLSASSSSSSSPDEVIQENSSTANDSLILQELMEE